MEEYQLSALDIKELDEFTADIEAADTTLRIALQYHSNLHNEIQKKRREWWQKMAEKYGFDCTVNHRTDRRYGGVYIVKVEKKCVE